MDERERPDGPDRAADDLAGNPDEWKERARQQFAEWLETLPDRPEETEEDSDDAPDLFSFFTALQKLQTETRTLSRKTVESFAHFGEALEGIASTSASASDAKAVSDFVLPVIALFDRVVRIHTQLKAPPSPRRFFNDRRWNSYHGTIAAAIELLRSHVRGLMDTMGIQRIPVVGEQFDPRSMAAREVVDSSDLPDNQVVEEIAAGYRCGEVVVRLADVKVARNR